MNSMRPRLAILNSPSKLKARVAFGAVFRDLAIVDVAGQLGGVLVLLVLGLKRADADAILLGKGHPPHPDIVHHARPIAGISFHPLIEHLATERAQVPFDRDLELVMTTAAVQDRRHLGSMLLGDQMERFLMHGADGVDLFTIGPFFCPTEAIKAPLVNA